MHTSSHSQNFVFQVILEKKKDLLPLIGVYKQPMTKVEILISGYTVSRKENESV